MEKLTQEGNSYTINNKKKFIDNDVHQKSIEKAFIFAWDMTLGNIGEHRSHRSGGDVIRNNVEKFANTFQGKLAEYVVHMNLFKKGVRCKPVDNSIHGLGIWDDVDLICNDKMFNIKSFPFFGNLLLLEVNDWDSNGKYKPNDKSYDYHICVRIKPDFKDILRSLRKLYSNDITRDEIWGYIVNENWYYDIAGYVENDVLIKAINSGQTLPKGGLLNGITEMDASNYYIQTGDLINFEKIIL